MNKSSPKLDTNGLRGALRAPQSAASTRKDHYISDFVQPKQISGAHRQHSRAQGSNLVTQPARRVAPISIERRRSRRLYPQPEVRGRNTAADNTRRSSVGKKQSAQASILLSSRRYMHKLGRHALRATAKHQASTKPLSRIQKIVQNVRSIQRVQAVMYSAAVFLALVGGFIGYSGWKANQSVSAQVQDLRQNARADDDSDGAPAGTPPSTDKPSSTTIRNYTVAPNTPRYITIPKLDVHARTFGVSVDKNNELKVPRNIHDTGWYMGSSRPGEAGAMLIDGHAGVGQTAGIFHDLGKLVKDDQIVITQGDGQKFSYSVVSVETVDVGDVDMSSLLVSSNTAKPGLSLITCAGDRIPGTFELTKRTIVRAVLP